MDVPPDQPLVESGSENPPKTKAPKKDSKKGSNAHKQRKKEERAKEVIAKREGKTEDEVFSDKPTQYCYLAGFGAGCHVSHEQLDAFFGQYAGFEKVIMEKAKPWINVMFKSPEEMEFVVNKLHRTQSEQFSRPFLFYYSKLIPSGVSPADHASTTIPGLVLKDEFLTGDEEAFLIKTIEASEGEWEVLNRRQVKHWGYVFDYKTKLVNKDTKSALPEWCDKVIDKIMDQGLLPFRPDQVTVNMYEPGAGIPQHVETHSAFEDGIISITLLGQTVMDLKHPDGQSIPILLTPRSALVLSGESRYYWTHGINGRMTDVLDDRIVDRTKRISITCRKIKMLPCQCKYRAQCDSWLKTHKGLENDNTKIEEDYVKDVYDTIAPHFSDTRHTPWPKIQAFLNSQPAGTLVCDVGCGNGKYLGVSPNCFCIGTDQSVSLIDIAFKKGHQAFVASNLHLPFRDECFDVVISIAVIHHFSTKEHRIKAISELKRVLKPGGSMLIYVWAMEQEVGKKTFGQQDVMVPWHLEQKYVDELLAKEDSASEKIKQMIETTPTIQKQDKTYVVFQRYYHVFRKGELTSLVKEIPGLEVGPEEFDHANWVVCATKSPVQIEEDRQQ